MKKFLTILLILLINNDLQAQEKKRIFSTRDLAIIAEQFGPDSCLRQMRISVPINLIDTSLAILLSSKYIHGKSYLQFTQFIAAGVSMRNELIKSKTISIIKDYSMAIYDIDEEYLFVLLFQGDSTLIPMLQDLFRTWEYRADSIKRHYPSNLKRFFHRLKGLPRYEEIHSTCRRNCYKLAWTINRLDSSKMPFGRVEAIRKQILPTPLPSEMSLGYYGYYHPSRIDTIQLSNHYNTIDEIDLDREPAFLKHKEDLVGQMCANTLITNNIVALYEIGCHWAPLAGRGKTLRLVLFKRNKLIIEIIQAWIS